MTLKRKKPEQLHERRYFPRLTDEYAEKLERYAQQKDVDKNTLARMLIVEKLDEVTLEPESNTKKHA